MATVEATGILVEKRLKAVQGDFHSGQDREAGTRFTLPPDTI